MGRIVAAWLVAALTFAASFVLYGVFLGALAIYWRPGYLHGGGPALPVAAVLALITAGVAYKAVRYPSNLIKIDLNSRND
jgi:hypothetical protein